MEPPKKRAPIPSVDGAGGLASEALSRGLLKPEQIKTFSGSKSELDAEAARVEFGKSVLEHGFLTVDQLGSLIRDVRSKVAPCPGCRKDLNIEECAPGTPIICDGCGQLLNVPASFETPKTENPGAPARGPRLLANRYEFVTELGIGGMGMVYQAIDRSLRRTVALKILRSEMAHDARAVSRFEAEARAAARLSHPNIISVHDMGASSDGFYIAMDYVPSGSFRDAMNRKETLKKRVATLAKVAHAVAYAHSKGVIHRDLKPENILIDARSEPIVTDFGLAKVKDSEMQMTRQGLQIGTPLYMSPEQARGDVQAIDARTDVYALGVILYEILAGRPPHIADDLPELYRQIISEDPARPGSLAAKVPYDLELIAMKAIERERHHRYPGAAAFAAELDRWLAGEPIQTRPATTLRRIARRVVRNRIPVVIGIVAVATAVAVIVVVRQERLKRDEDANVRRMEKEREEKAERLFATARDEFNRIESNPALGRQEVGQSYQTINGLLDTAIQLFPTDRFYLLRGRVLLRLMKVDAARNDAESAIRLAPQSAEGYLLRAEANLMSMDSTLLGDMFYPDEGGLRAVPVKPATAAELKRAEALDEELTRVRLLAGKNLSPTMKGRIAYVEGFRLTMRQDWAAARPRFLETVTVDPGNAGAWYLLGMSQLVSQDFTGAAESAGRALALAPRNSKFVAFQIETEDCKLILRERNGENCVQERLKLLRALDAALPHVETVDMNIILRRGNIVCNLAPDLGAEMLEDLRISLQYFRTGDAKNPGNPSVLRALSDVLLQIGMNTSEAEPALIALQESRDRLRRLPESTGDDTYMTACVRGMLAEANFRIGLAVERTGDGSGYFREAIEAGDACLAFMKVNWHCLELLAFSHLYLGSKGVEAPVHLPAAIDALTRLLKGPAIYKVPTLGRRADAYERLGKLDEALHDLEEMAPNLDGAEKANVERAIGRVKNKIRNPK